MAILGRRNAQVAVPEPEPPRRSLLASALRFRFDDASYSSWRFRDESWQRELWRLYRITPELRAAASWVGQCCSRVRIYVANVDDLGRVQGETKNKKVPSIMPRIIKARSGNKERSTRNEICTRTKGCGAHYWPPMRGCYSPAHAPTIEPSRRRRPRRHLSDLQDAARLLVCLRGTPRPEQS